MRGRLRWLLLVGLVVVLGVVLRTTLLRAEPVAVPVAPVEPGAVEETVTNTRAATVTARRRARLSPQVGGLVTALPHREGERVEAGDLVLQLDDRQQLAALELARRQVWAAQATAEEACVAARLAERELARIQALAEQGITAERGLDAAGTEAERSRAACRAAGARVAQAEAQVDSAQVQLELTEVRAPFAGLVAEVSTEVGEWITPSPPGVPIPPVVDLLDPATVYVSAPIDEVDAERVRPMQEARITVDSRRGEVFEGRVLRVAPYVLDQLEQNRTIEVEVVFLAPEVEAGVPPGTSADVEIVLRRVEDVLRVPASAVAEDDTVLVLSDGRLTPRAIGTGLGNWQWVEVTDGLRAGELVVTARLSTDVRPGARAVAAD